MRNIFKICPHPAPTDRGAKLKPGIHERRRNLDGQRPVKTALASGWVKRHEIQRFALQMT